MKYLIYKNEEAGVMGPILFPKWMSYEDMIKDIVSKNYTVVSYGEFRTYIMDDYHMDKICNADPYIEVDCHQVSKEPLTAGTAEELIKDFLDEEVELKEKGK